MELDEAIAYLREHARNGEGDPNLRVMKEAWAPFSGMQQEFFREIYLLDALPLGKGTFGLVFPVLVRFATMDGKSYYIPAAMKMAPLVRDHVIETVNSMAINDLVHAGMTPGVPIFIGSFCVCTALEDCRMPPVSWTDLWKAFDNFVFVKRTEIRQAYGEEAVYSVDDKAETARVSRGYTVGFYFTELSPYGLSTQINPKKKPTTKTVLNGSKMLSDTYCLFQTLQAMQLGGYLHADISSTNILESGPLKSRPFRTFMPMYSTGNSISDHETFMGKTNEASDPNAVPYAFIQCPDILTYMSLNPSTDQRDNAVVIRHPTIPYLIDFGAMLVARIPRYSLARDFIDAFDRCHANKLENLTVNDFPRFLLGSAKPTYLHNQAHSWFLPLSTPITYPTTSLYSRAAEQLNPILVTRKNVPVCVVAHTELSDNYSMAAVLISKLVGFDIFGQTVPLIIKSDLAADAPYVVGIPADQGFMVHTQSKGKNNYYRLDGTFGTMARECPPTQQRTSADGYDLRHSTQHQPLKTSTTMTPDGVTEAHCYYSDSTRTRWCHLLPPFDFKTGKNYSNSLAVTVENYLKLRLPKVGWANQWFTFKDDKFTDASFELEVFAIVARIEAMGVPGPEECQGTNPYFLLRLAFVAEFPIFSQEHSSTISFASSTQPMAHRAFATAGSMPYSSTHSPRAMDCLLPKRMTCAGDCAAAFPGIRCCVPMSSTCSTRQPLRHSTKNTAKSMSIPCVIGRHTRLRNRHGLWPQMAP